MLKRIRATRDDGFTLTELLIVIVVLGILAGIVVFAVATFRDDSKVASCQADKKTVEVAMEAYRAKNGTYPATTALLDTQNYIKDDILPAKGYSFTINTTTGVVTVVPGTGSPAGFTC